jgi:ABC-type phosphate/phosphonate transport system substrate-binding protein
VLATVAKRMDERRWKELEAAFLHVSKDPAGREALDGVRLEGFVPLDEQALTTARAAYRRAR